jgi:ABC-2 type transport system permease protein
VRKTLRLARREYLAAVRTKGFIIAIVVFPLMMGGSGIGMALLKDQVDTKDKRVAVIDRSGAVADALIAAAGERNKEIVLDPKTGKKVKPAYVLEAVTPDERDPNAQRLALSDRVRAGELHAFVDIGPDVLQAGGDSERSRITYYAKNAVLDDVREWMGWPLNQHLRRARLLQAGMEPDMMEGMMRWINVEGLGLVTVDASGKVQEARRSSEIEAIVLPFGLMMLMFMMMMMGAMPQLQSVMEEKSQRIAEVLLGSIKPFQFMMGKVIGALGVTLTASLVYVIVGTVAARRFGVAEYVPYAVLPWFFAYMLLAIAMLGSLLAALGAACNDAKEAQGITMPAMMPIMIPMFVAMPVLQQPQSTFSTVMSLVPPFTPMLMLLRQTAPGGVPGWQPWVGLTGVLLFTLLVIWAGGRIFRVGILMQGSAPKLGNLVRWAVKG